MTPRLAMIVGAAALALTHASLASGQTGAKLTRAEIDAAFRGKNLRATTDKITTGDPANPASVARRTDGGYSVVEFEIRTDNSMIWRCASHDRFGRAHACKRSGGGTRDVGIWSIEGDHFCWRWLEVRGGQKQCYDVFREGSRFRLRLASGPLSTIDDELVELQ